MSMSKNAWVSEVWNPVGDGDGWTPLFARAFNDWEIDLVERLLQEIHAFRVQREEEDRVIWTASNDVKATLLGWNGGFVGKRRNRAWQMAPLCIFWSVWKERNRPAFGNEETLASKVEIFFCMLIFGLGSGFP
ncbi:hypothetical protein CK203_090231 [Vitis vinifera]|uniref:Uncharacterized protein n=1 Tax=Vitis vinifera TaxID=29760 RepID=A0A438CIV9_VITVI|nr:hypothetical protein CK203_090231 [Vitis vinifera]